MKRKECITMMMCYLWKLVTTKQPDELSSCLFFVRFAISGKDEDWQEALSSNKSNMNVISVTSTKRKGQPTEEQTKPRKKQKKSKHKHKTG